MNQEVTKECSPDHAVADEKVSFRKFILKIKAALRISVRDEEREAAAMDSLDLELEGFQTPRDSRLVFEAIIR